MQYEIIFFCAILLIINDILSKEIILRIINIMIAIKIEIDININLKKRTIQESDKINLKIISNL